MEVRNITRRITDMNDKLDGSLTLVEPRENAFLRYDSSTEHVMHGITQALKHFGQLSVIKHPPQLRAHTRMHLPEQVSRTYPPLCTARVCGECSVFLRSCVVVTTVDYNGAARTSGGDPVQARFVAGDKLQDALTDMAVHVEDCQNGTYELTFR